MRAAPAVTVILARSRFAVAALAMLALTSIVASGAWAMGRGDLAGSLVLALVCAHAAWLARSVARRPALRLRWDGQRWWLGETTGEGEHAGQLGVALDLGAWMLLRFRADAAPARPRSRWLPAERRDLAGQWHALRCAVYSPHAAATAPDVPV